MSPATGLKYIRYIILVPKPGKLVRREPPTPPTTLMRSVNLKNIDEPQLTRNGLHSLVTCETCYLGIFFNSRIPSTLECTLNYKIGGIIERAR